MGSDAMHGRVGGEYGSTVVHVPSSSHRTRQQPTRGLPIHSGPSRPRHLQAATPIEMNSLNQVAPPLCTESWASALEEHPDVEFRWYIVQGLTHGFLIGIDRRQSLRAACYNIPSAEAHPTMVSEYLETEVNASRIVGPLSMAGLHVNRMGVIPKGHTPGKWRLITDLSFPPGCSVNDGINQRVCSMSYITVDMVVKELASLGPGALMAKVDVEAAYRLVPVHPDDRPLLAVQWKGAIFCDAMLPFGLRSTRKSFSAVADALEWCCKRRGASFVEHYLDDYITMGPPDSNRSANDLQLWRRYAPICRCRWQNTNVKAPRRS